MNHIGFKISEVQKNDTERPNNKLFEQYANHLFLFSSHIFFEFQDILLS